MRFVLRDLDFYARQTQAIRRAARTVTPGWESIYYNENRGFTLQTQALLAALRPGDTADAVHRKVALVADFLDIWLARRVWNFRTIAYSSVKYTLFTITRELRRRDDDLVSLSEYLLGYLEGQAETFETQATFRLHQQNYRQVRHTLARLTHWVDTQCGLASHFEDLVSLGKARPFEIEHIWADKYKRYASLYSHPHDFAQARNKIGGLLLLQRGLNQSLGASTYAVKRKAYLSKGANLLARSLHPETYNHNPAFQRFLRETGLPFCPHEDFGPQEQAQRQALYTRLAAQVWSVERVRVGDAVADTDAAQDPTEAPRRERNKAFWTQLLAASAACSGLHAGISPRGDSWLDTQRHGQKWAYVLNSDQARIQLHMDHKDRARNKALFDALRQEQGAIEEALGHALTWKRRGDQISSQIAYTLPVPAGREQPERWPALIDAAVGAMERFYAVLGPRVVAHAPQDGA
jgi:hypothetical protein